MLFSASRASIVRHSAAWPKNRYSMPRRTSASRKKRAEAAGTCERKFSSFITTTVAPDVRLWQEARTTPPLEARISHVRTRLHTPAAPDPDGGGCQPAGNRGQIGRAHS